MRVNCVSAYIYYYFNEKCNIEKLNKVIKLRPLPTSVKKLNEFSTSNDKKMTAINSK